MAWIFTREGADTVDERARLERAGVAVLAVPCVEFADLPWPAWDAGGGTPLTFLTSRRAARRYVEHQQPGGLVAGMSPATSDELVKAGVRVDFTAKGGVVALASAVAFAWNSLDRPRWSIRYPTSDQGLDTPEQAEAVQILERLGPVQRAALYVTRAPSGLSEALRTATAAPWSVTFSSPSAVSAFLAGVGAYTPAAPQHVLCVGRSTVRAWNERKPSSWRDAVVTSSVVDTITSLEES